MREKSTILAMLTVWMFGEKGGVTYIKAHNTVIHDMLWAVLRVVSQGLFYAIHDLTRR